MTTRVGGALPAVMTAALVNVAAVAVQGVIMARFLGVSGQGALTLVTTVAALLVVALSLGTGASLRLRSRTVPAKGDVSAYVGLSLLMALGAGATTPALVNTLRPGAVSTASLALSAVFGALLLVARQAGDLVQAHGRTAASILSVGVGAVGQTLFFAGVVVAGAASVELALVSGVLGAVVQIGFCLACLAPFDLPLYPAGQTAVWRELVAVGAPSLGYTLGLLAMQRIDRLILIALVGTSAGGVYSVAATVAEGARITSSAVGQLLFVRTASGGGISLEVRRLYRLAVIAQVVTLAGLALAVPWIVDVFFGSAYLDAIPLTRGLLVAEFCMGLALMDSRIVMGLGRLGEVGRVTVGMVGGGLLVYLPLILGYGAGGAVAASAAIYAVYSLTLYRRRVRYRETKAGLVDV